MNRAVRLDRGWQLRQENQSKWMDVPFMPMQVHEILFAHGVLSGDFEIGLGEDCK